MIVAEPPPISRIPCELLSDIMDRSLVPLDLMTLTSFDPRAAPWTYTRVSKLFRSVALNTSALWSTINVTLQLNSPKAKDDPQSFKKWTNFMLQRLTLQLDLARQQPLDISIFYNEDDGDTGLQPCDILEALWPRREYWQTLILDGIFLHNYDLNSLPGADDAVFPRLRCLKTPVTCIGSEVFSQSPESLGYTHLDARNLEDCLEVYEASMSVFDNAPNLTVVELGPTPFRTHEYDWTWLKCQQVTLHCLTPEEVKQVFPYLPEVRTLYIEYSRFEDQSFFAPAYLCLARFLTTLTVKDFEDETLECLTAPNLVDLYLSHIQVDDALNGPWHAFIRRSGCKIMFLRFDSFLTSDYLSFLETVPTLLTLEISMPRIEGVQDLGALVGALETWTEKTIPAAYPDIPQRMVRAPRCCPCLTRLWVTVNHRTLMVISPDQEQRVTELIKSRERFSFPAVPHLRDTFAAKLRRFDDESSSKPLLAFPPARPGSKFSLRVSFYEWDWWMFYS